MNSFVFCCVSVIFSPKNIVVAEVKPYMKVYMRSYYFCKNYRLFKKRYTNLHQCCIVATYETNFSTCI